MSAAAIGLGVGGILGGLYASETNQDINDDNLEFQQYMASNAHQLQVQDMRAAGLNPILSATGGSGAKASGGSNVGVQNPVKDAINSALTAKLNKEQIKQINATTTATSAQAEKTKAETEIVKASIPTANIKEEALTDIYGKLRDVGKTKRDIKDRTKDAFNRKFNKGKKLKVVTDKENKIKHKRQTRRGRR